MMYGWSITHCLPASRTKAPSAAVGTAIRPTTVAALASDAGFASCEVVDVDAGFFRLYRLGQEGPPPPDRLTSLTTTHDSPLTTGAVP
jgi:hypothetical protein